MPQLEERSARDAGAAVSAGGGLTVAAVVRTWWPLAASWLFMGIELPAFSVVMARLPMPEVNLAAFGGIVFPVSLLIESPIIMLLAASTALCRDAASYRKLLRFATRTAAALTVLHAACAFTPLYDLVVVPLIDAPPEVIEPGRVGLQLMTFWTWCVADRRFHQGVLIRFGRARSVISGTCMRLVGAGSTLAIGAALGLPGVAAASLAWAVGVFCEMMFIRWAVAPVLREQVVPAPPQPVELTTRRMVSFYLPLALTPFLTLATGPIGAAAISRMPAALASLAAWSVVHTSLFLLRSVGMAFNEVVVRHAEDPGAARALSRFAVGLALVVTGIVTVVALTPLSTWLFAGVFDLPPDLSELAARWLWLGIPLPALAVVHSLYQGYLVNASRTRAITEAVAIYLAICTVIQVGGVFYGGLPGLAVALVAVTIAAIAQAIWLWTRVRALPVGTLA